MQAPVTRKKFLSRFGILSFVTLLMLTLGACASPKSATPSESLAATSGNGNGTPALYCQKERIYGSRIKRFVCLTGQELENRREDSAYLVEATRFTSRSNSIDF